MAAQGRTVEQVIARIASRQKGVVTHAELLHAGVTRHEIAARIAKGLLIRVHRGVYRVGHRAPSTEATDMAAVKACGDGAALSGPAAAHLLSFIKGPPPPPEVTTRTERRVEGVITRRSRALHPHDVMSFKGIPVTTPARTLVDLAATLPEPALARACHEAQVRYRTEPEDVEAVLARLPRAKGAATLRRILRGDTKLTLSGLERAFLALLRKHELPLPETNHPAGGHYVDCRWPAHGLTVELDSYRFHSSRHAWLQDRRRERQAYLRGDEPRRYTDADVFEDPGAMLPELRGLLATQA